MTSTPNLPAFPGTNFDRPEDLEIESLRKGRQLLFVATTTNTKVFAIDLKQQVVTLYASRATLDVGTQLPASVDFTSPDNIAIDNEGNIYIVEDQPGGIDDIWFTYDKNSDGVAESMAKWASLSTKGAESTGLYFDKFQSNIAYVNVQHPDSGVDRTIMITTPCECCDDDHGHGNDD